MANTTAPVINGMSQPGSDFSPQPNVKYTLKNTPNALNVASNRTSIFIISEHFYLITLKTTISQPGIPYITVGLT